MHPRLGILGIVAGLLLGVLAMRELADKEPAGLRDTGANGSTSAADADARPPDPARAAGAGEAPGTIPGRYSAGTIWLEAPEVMEVGQVAEVRVIVEAGENVLASAAFGIQWDPTLAHIEPAPGFRRRPETLVRSASRGGLACLHIDCIVTGELARPGPLAMFTLTITALEPGELSIGSDARRRPDVHALDGNRRRPTRASVRATTIQIVQPADR